jgi:obg-like ATPase 1
MPGKKKKEVDSRPVFLGRPKNNVSIGIVGLPNVGKSSFFNVLSKLNVAAENYPFCTIDPNFSRVPVPDKRFRFLCQKHSPKSEVQAVLSVTDIAGLIGGASEGAGLGNSFLSHIQACDAIYHMVRAFDDPAVTHVEDSVDPIRDMEIIMNELVKKDMQYITTAIEGETKRVERGIATKEEADDYAILLKIRTHLEERGPVRFAEWGAKEIVVLNRFQLLTAKPMVFLANLKETSYKKQRGKYLPAIAEWIQTNCPGEPLIPFSAAFEEQVMACGEDKAQVQAYYATCAKGVRSCLPKIIKTGYKTLRLINFFTAGHDEVRAWTLREFSTAPEAAGVIHGDMQKGFICAEIYSFADFKEHGSEAAVKAKGLCRQQGRKYTIVDGDICFFQFNAPKAGKKKPKA